jgi:LysM repeat protein
MQKYGHQWRIGCMAIAILLLASGCFQAAGTGPDGLSVAGNTNPTWTPSPFPTSEPLIVTQSVIVTATQDPFALEAPPIATQDFTVEDSSVAQFPTQDPNAFGQESQVDLDPIYVTATYIVQRATETEAFNLTMTAGAPFATATPSIGEFPTMTATFSSGGTGGACTHTVVAGDNLFRIAMRYNVTIDQISQANGISNPNVIVVGDQLQIPGCGGTAGDGGVTGDGGTGGPIGSGSSYTVQQGDTLYKISLRFNVPVMSIAAANNIQNINLIHINQQLVIPPA